MDQINSAPHDADEFWMREALTLARQAAAEGEVPVGAVVVLDNVIVGRGWNRPIANHDATAHAEIEALRDACARVGNYRLPGAALYATLEPCAMCAGACVNARIACVVYGADDLRAGAVHTVFSVFDAPELTHRVAHVGGILAADSAVLLRRFFRARRGG